MTHAPARPQKRSRAGHRERGAHLGAARWPCPAPWAHSMSNNWLRKRIEVCAGALRAAARVVATRLAMASCVRPERTVNWSSGSDRSISARLRSYGTFLGAYAAGESPRSIAKALNRKGIPGPSGGTWGPSTINGNAARGTGILNNELYIGKLVWNRLRYVKNPETGRRQSRLNPPEAWIVKDVPELRIVPQELWDAVKTRQAEMVRTTRPDRKKEDFWKHLPIPPCQVHSARLSGTSVGPAAAHCARGEPAKAVAVTRTLALRFSAS